MLIPNPSSRIPLEQHLERPLHGARSTLRDDRLPRSTSGVDAIVPNNALRTFELCCAPRLTRLNRLKISHRAWNPRIAAPP